MALDFARAGQLPAPPKEYSQEQLRQAFRVLELYFGQLDSDMWNHAQRYTAKQFVALDGAFYGGRYFGTGFYLDQEFQRFTSLVQQAVAPVGSAGVAHFESLSFPANGITLVAPSKLTVSIAGNYAVTYTLQIASLNGQQNVYVWLRVNGADRPATSQRYSIWNVGVVGATFTFMPVLAAGDYVEIAWSATDPNVYLWTEAARVVNPGVNPAIPASPSAVVNMQLLQGAFPVDATLPLPRRLRPP